MVNISTKKLCLIISLLLISLYSNAYGNSIFEIHLVHPDNDSLANTTSTEISGYTKFEQANGYPKIVWVNQTIEIDVADLKSVTCEPNEDPPFVKFSKHKSIPSQKITFYFNEKVRWTPKPEQVRC